MVIDEPDYEQHESFNESYQGNIVPQDFYMNLNS